MKTYKLLHVIGTELLTAAATAEQIQDGLSPALSPALLDQPEAMRSWQELDRLAQTIHALAQVVMGLSEAADQEQSTEPQVIAAVRLSQLAARLQASGDAA